MRIGVIFCSCAGQITEKIDFSKIEELIKNKISWIKSYEVICAEDKKNEIINFLRKKKPEAVLFLACSPLNKEEVFREIAAQAEVNPYMISVVNLREHVAWVTLDKREALKKAYVLCIAALGRIKKQKPLIARKIPITDDILIVGGGVAGITAAKTLSKAGKKVYLVEKETALGGKVTKYEKIFPDLSCGPCFMHPLVSDLLDSSIELMLNSELIEIKGFYGNIHAKIKTKPIYVDYKKCIGCSACEHVCPEKAIRVYPMRLPPVAVVDSDRCLRFKEKMCSYCINECPVESIDFSEEQKELNLKVGVVLWATGFRVFDCSSFPQLGYRKFKDIYD
ncbi:MAG: FAD-dependent oxidoreductase, partial [Thermodesulfovibrionaceae bacterium]